MGLITGGLNGRRFLASGLPDDFRKRLVESVCAHAFVAVPNASDAELRVGWVDVFNPANAVFEQATFMFDHFVCLTLRIDKKTVNGAYKKIALTERLAAIKVLRGVEKLSKTERTDAEEALDAELFARALPSVAAVNVAWDTDSGEVIIFTASEQVLELVKKRFEITFGAHLRPERMVDWLDDMPWDEIGQRIDDHFPDARGSRAASDVREQEDPFEGVRFEVAADFITWLWLESEASEGRFKDADLTLWLETRLKLQDVADHDAPETTILIGVAPSGTETARRDLHTGKRPVEARLGLKLGEIECGLTLIAAPDGLMITGLKLPFEVKDGKTEKIYERMLLLDLMQGTLKKLFLQFFVARTTPGWADHVQAWLTSESET